MGLQVMLQVYAIKVMTRRTADSVVLVIFFDIVPVQQTLIASQTGATTLFTASFLSYIRI